MKYSTIVFAVAFSTVSLARPAKRDATFTDTNILNFALTLEHLESTYYSKGMEKYSEKDFLDAGFPAWTRNRYLQIAAHEKTHVAFLSAALGSNAVEACEYNFPDNNVEAFVALSNTLEQVGTSAYVGAAEFIDNKGYLTAAATILTVEARHAAWVGSAVRKGSAWGTPFDIPLDLNQVYTIASGLITHCPPTNAPRLPSSLKAFPALSVVFPSSMPESINVVFNAPSNEPLFVAFLTSNGIISTPLKNVMRSDDGSVRAEAMVPSGMLGYVYVAVTNDQKVVNDSTTIAGPTVVEFSFDAMGNVVSRM